MSVRRSRRTAAAAAETRIAKVVEEDSDESSNSTFGDRSRRQSSTESEESASSGNASDADFDDMPLASRPPQKGRKSAWTNSNSAGDKTSNGTAPPNSSAPSTDDSSNPSSGEKEQVDDAALKLLMRGFRLTDLQALMVFVGKNKAGRKNDLMERAVELIDTTSGDIKNKLSEKIQELSNAMYKSISSAPSVNPYSPNYRPTPNAGAYNPNNPNNPAPLTQTGSSSYLPSMHLSNSENGSASSGRSITPPSVPRYEPSYQSNPYYRESSHLMYPTYPDVKLRSLPFYKIEAVLMKPSSLQPRGLARFQDQTFSFHLTPQQASAIGQSSFRDSYGRQEFKKQIQLRFSLLETSCEQDDNFPASVCVKVNGRLQTLPNPIPTNKPGVEPKRPPKPINITGLCKLSSTVPNYVNVTWAVEVGSGYTVSVYFVDKLSSIDLMDELKKKGKRHSDYTRAVIKDKLSDKEDEIATTSCKVTLACPLGKMRMTTPCRASTCDHLQCFDASLYLMMNEKKPKWMCPVCNKSALYENLLIDGYFTDVLTSKRLPSDEHEIVLNSDASWDPLVPAKKNNEENEKRPNSPVQERMKKVSNVETLSLDDDEDEEPSIAPPKNLETVKNRPGTSKEVDYVTLDSDDDDDDVIAPPHGKRQRLEDDDNSDSVSALTPTSVTPPPMIPLANHIPLQSFAQPPIGSQSPEIICLDDD